MREILFRGKKQNGEWLYGDLVHRGEKIFIFSENAQNSPDYYEVEPETVGQLIGLTDKNGVKIFEGDIMLHPEFIQGVPLVVGFKKGYYHLNGWACNNIKFDIGQVIGNVHENQ